MNGRRIDTHATRRVIGEKPGMQVVIRGGHVIDPANGIDGPRDMLIVDGVIAQVAEPGTALAADARQVEADGHLVVPGLIDIHTHLFRGTTSVGLDYSRHSFSDGVALVVDAGSAGAHTVAGLLETVIDQSDDRALAFVNISSVGIIHYSLAELRDPQYLDLDAVEQALRRRRDVLLGIKIRLAQSVFGGDVELARTALRGARDVAERTGTRLMVHVVAPILPLCEVLKNLRPGDIVTHAFHGSVPGTVLDSEDDFRAAVAAQRRGVVLDLGCGHTGMSLDVLRRSIKRGLLPDTISTDLTEQAVAGPVHSLTLTMSKVLACGMPLPEVIAAVTSRAAATIGRFPRHGTLSVGSRADVTVLAPVSGAFQFEHPTRTGGVDVVEGGILLEPVLGFRDGTPHVLTGTLRLRPPSCRTSQGA